MWDKVQTNTQQWVQMHVKCEKLGHLHAGFKSFILEPECPMEHNGE